MMKLAKPRDEMIFYITDGTMGSSNVVEIEIITLLPCLIKLCPFILVFYRSIGVGRGGGAGGGGGGGGGGGRGGGGSPPPPIILEGGPTYPLAPPNNPPAFSFNFYVKQEKNTNVPS